MATKTLGYDSMQLLSNVVRSSSSVKDVVVDQARQSNRAAVLWLNLEKEAGLIRYHGFVGYLKKQRNNVLVAGWTTSRFGSTKAMEQHNPSSQTPKQQQSVAKVAFMITAAQKSELSNTLGYSTEQIKKLKPVEAALILQHQIPPADPEGQLPQLLTEHNNNALLSSQSQQQPKQTQAKQEDAEIDLLNESFLEKAPTPSSVLSRNHSRNDLWFEVVETAEDGTETIHGLYRDEEEANVCLDWKETAKKRYEPHERVAFAVRETTRS